MDNQPMGNTQTPIYQEPQGKSAKWLWLLVIILIIGGLVFAYVRGIGPFKQLSFLGKATESPSPTVSSFSSPPAEASPTVAEVDKSEASIRVLNGNGKAGSASAIKDFLESKGYKVATLGNAANYDFTETELRFKDAFKNFEDVLTSDLSSKYAVLTNPKPLEASDSADIEVTVGAE